VKALLISPPPPPSRRIALGAQDRAMPPLGLGFVASALENAGHEVKIFDNNLFRIQLEELVGKVGRFSPEVIGIGCTSAVYSEAKKMASVLKEVFQVPIIMGGPHPTLRPYETLSGTKADIVVQGEGEHSIVELIKCLEKNGNLNEVQGICYKKNAGITCNPPRALIRNMDDIPPPAWHLLPMEKYPRKDHLVDIYPLDAVNTSRGCPFHCRFCSNQAVWGRTYRSFSPERIVSDMSFLIDNYKTRGVYFREDNFTVNRKRVLNLCRLMREERMDLSWICEARVDLVDYELLTAMKKAGCERVWFGVESACNRVLALIDKGITISQSMEAFKLCKQVGIHTGASLMIGIPGETIEEMKRTLELRAKLVDAFDATVWINIYVGYPTSPLYEQIIRKGWYKNMDEGGICEVATPYFDRKRLEKILRQSNMRQRLRALKRGDLTELFAEFVSLASTACARISDFF
jgi:radical SAM superfamily enzyme YgiQ (UPF0313 family)